MSGVYIKGMEMPNECRKCTLVTQYYDGGVDVCCLLDKYAQRKGKLDDCPLILVPDHGDLIDRREAIIDANERAYDFWNCDADVDSTVAFLNEQTTIIPGEEAGNG